MPFASLLEKFCVAEPLDSSKAPHYLMLSLLRPEDPKLIHFQRKQKLHCPPKHMLLFPLLWRMCSLILVTADEGDIF
jgi:hypothetical protein